MATRIEVGIILRVGKGAPPVIIGAVVDHALLGHALRAAIAAAERRAGGAIADVQAVDRLPDFPKILM
jgi:hypothetical protein